jgi:hypothetical protein
MTHTHEHKLEDAKDHLGEAKKDVTSAAHDKVVEKVTEAGEKIKEEIDHLVKKITPDKIER